MICRALGCNKSCLSTTPVDDAPCPSSTPEVAAAAIAMSTPSTATAAHPPHHHQFYSHHQQYQQPLPNAPLTNGNGRIANPSYAGYSNPTGAPPSHQDLRRTATAHTRQLPQLQAGDHPPPPTAHARQLPQLPSMSSIAPEGNMDPSRRPQKKRNPNWAEFYKHGLPKEVIVIDDDDDVAPAARPLPQAAPQPPTNAPATVTRHADKKRKPATTTEIGRASCRERVF